MTDTAFLLDELRSRGVTVAVVGDKLRVEAPRGTIEPNLLQTLRERKREIIRLLAQSQVETSLTSCGSPHCGGCYSISGRRFLHPPKVSQSWKEWFEQWQPKGDRLQ